MTKREALELALTAVENDDARKVFMSMIDQLDRRANSERKLSPKEQAKHEEVEAFRQKVYEYMSAEPDGEFTCKALADAMEVSIPKMTATLTALSRGGRIKGEHRNGSHCKYWRVNVTAE